MSAAVARNLCSPKVGGERALGGDRADFLADPAVDRRWRDRILDVPVGAFVLEADRRPHQARARRESELVRAHRAEAQIGLAEARLGLLAALERADDGRRQRPGELRLPDEVDVAELRAGGGNRRRCRRSSEACRSRRRPSFVRRRLRQARTSPVTSACPRKRGGRSDSAWAGAAHSAASAHAYGAALYRNRRLPSIGHGPRR